MSGLPVIPLVRSSLRPVSFVAGELRSSGALSPVACGPRQINAFGGTVAIDGLHVERLAGFAGRGSSSVIERHLPGIPPATDLRGCH